MRVRILVPPELYSKNEDFFLIIEDEDYSKSRTKIGLSVDKFTTTNLQKYCSYSRCHLLCMQKYCSNSRWYQLGMQNKLQEQKPKVWNKDNSACSPPTTKVLLMWELTYSQSVFPANIWILKFFFLMLYAVKMSLDIRFTSN